MIDVSQHRHHRRAALFVRFGIGPWIGMLVAVPVVGLLALAGAAAAPALGGWVFTWKPVTPNFGSS